MRKDKSIHDHIVHDLLSHIPDIDSKAMFGGWGIYKDGIFFAIIAEGELYFKVGDLNKRDFEDADSHPFVYMVGKKPMTMNYWLVPEETLENKRKLASWVDKALQVARLAKKSKIKS